MALEEGIIDGIKMNFDHSSYNHATRKQCAPGWGFFLMAIDPGDGVISMEQWGRRMFYMKPELAEAAQKARFAGADPFGTIFAQDPEILAWLKQLRPELLPGDYSGPGAQVELKFEKAASVAPKPGLAQPAGMNTKTLPELEAAFAGACAAAGAEIDRGIVDGHICLEDSLPWFEVYLPGGVSAKKGKQFAKALAEAMNVRILFNRVEGDSTSCCAMGVMDIDWERARSDPNRPVPALSLDGEWAEWMDDYGEPVLPDHAAKKPKTRKPKP